jgi:LuxR family transcriptional regulator, maltose regulon positive regulatory protein
LGYAQGLPGMDSSVAGQYTGWPQDAAEPVFDLVAAKLLRPLVRPGTVGRTALIDRLRDDARPIVSMVAPAGYGKTTLLSQWAERNGHAFAWVSVDEADNDPKVLLTYVAESLNEVEPIGRQVFTALASPSSSVPGSVVPRLGSAFSSMISPVALVLDDVHLLRNSECRAALSVLADHVPAQSRLVLAGRSEPPLRIARLRAEGRITEIGPADLSLTAPEAAALLHAAEVVLDEHDVAELHRRTEGWPVGLYLASLYLRAGGSLAGAAASFGGDDLFVSEYMESEFLERISSSQRVFLTRTAVLERMSGPLCEAVLDVPGAGVILADLARSNLLLVPLDRRGHWYRYHHLFRDMLLAELERVEPGLIPVLRRRAADWCLRNGLTEEALEYSMAATAVDEAARLTEELWISVYRQGRIATVERWLHWLEEHGGIREYSMAPVAAGITAAQTGRPAAAERWADAVDRWRQGNPARVAGNSVEGWAAVLRALMCRDGVEQMRADADEAAGIFTAAEIVVPAAPALQGVARILCGDSDGAGAFLEEGIRIGDIASADTLTALWCEQCVLAMAHGQWDQAERFAAEAGAVVRRAGVEDPFASAVTARLAIHRGDVPGARRELVNAQRRRHLLTYATPHMAVQARIELVRVHLALADLAGARTLIGEIDEILRRRPGLGTLVGEVKALRARLAREHGPSVPGASALTAAELRLLPMLATHLSVPEIAAELFLSPHTIKSQMKSIYRKLDSTSRTQTVTRARELGLLEG